MKFALDENNSVTASSLRPSQTCIIIAGMHRSGTSAVARIVNLLGADITRDLIPAVAGDNDRGFWESKTVIAIHDRLLHALGSSYDDPLPLPNGWLKTEAASEARFQLADEIKKDFSESKVFVVKDPRITRLLPLWLTLLDDLAIEPVIVIPVRNPLEVVASFGRREMISCAQTLLIYIRSYLEVELASRGRRRIFVQYPQLLIDWGLLARKLEDIVALAQRGPKERVEAEINAFLSFDLYRNKATRDELLDTSHIAYPVVEMFDRMNEATSGTEITLRASFDRFRDTVTEATNLYQDLVIELRSDRESLRRKLAKQDVVSEALRTNLAQATRQNIALDERLAKQDAETDALRSNLAQATRQNIALDDMLTQQTIELKQMLASASWRITLPLRWVGQTFPVPTRHARRLFRTVWWCLTLQLKPRLWARRARRGDLELIASSKLFDREWYIGRYPDVRAAGVDAAQHYFVFGAKERRDPSSLFSSGWYLDRYRDVAASGMNPLVHYLRYGQEEGRHIIPILSKADSVGIFPNHLQHDSRWQTEAVCHGDCDCGAGGLFEPRASSPGDAG